MRIDQLRRLRDGVKARAEGSFEPPKFLGVDVADLLDSRDAAVVALVKSSAREGAALDEAGRLRDLVEHCYVHSGYQDCGYEQMDTPLKALYDRVVGK